MHPRLEVLVDLFVDQYENIFREFVQRHSHLALATIHIPMAQQYFEFFRYLHDRMKSKLPRTHCIQQIYINSDKNPVTYVDEKKTFDRPNMTETITNEFIELYERPQFWLIRSDCLSTSAFKIRASSRGGQFHIFWVAEGQHDTCRFVRQPWKRIEKKDTTIVQNQIEAFHKLFSLWFHPQIRVWPKTQTSKSLFWEVHTSAWDEFQSLFPCIQYESTPPAQIEIRKHLVEHFIPDLATICMCYLFIFT